MHNCVTQWNRQITVHFNVTQIPAAMMKDMHLYSLVVLLQSLNFICITIFVWGKINFKNSRTYKSKASHCCFSWS